MEELYKFLNDNIIFIVVGIAMIILITLIVIVFTVAKKRKKAKSQAIITTSPNEDIIPSNAIVRKVRPVEIPKPIVEEVKSEPIKIEPISFSVVKNVKTEEELQKERKKPGTIEIYIDNGNKFRFRLKATNLEIVAHSLGYESKFACKSAIKTIINVSDSKIVDITKDTEYKHLLGKAIYEVYKDAEGKYRFRLRDGGGNSILASQGYTTKQNCYNGIESVIRIVSNYIIADNTKKTANSDEKQKIK